MSDSTIVCVRARVRDLVMHAARVGAGPLLLAALALTAGCAATHTAANDFQVTNRSGFFEFRLGTAENFTMSQTYAWWNADSSAVVRQESDVRGGAGQLEIRDVDGAVMLSKSLREKGTVTTVRGKPGMWSVKVALDKTTGSVQLQVQGK